MTRSLLQPEQNCSQATVSHHPVHQNLRAEAHKASQGTLEAAPTVGPPRHPGEAKPPPLVHAPDQLASVSIPSPDPNNNPHPPSTPYLS